MAAFIRSVGKVAKNGIESTFWISHRIGDLEITMFAKDREQVCRKIVTKKVLPAEPERVIAAQPERIIEEVTWDCDKPILLVEKADYIRTQCPECTTITEDGELCERCELEKYSSKQEA